MKNKRRFLKLFASEFIGTGLLLTIGLSAVIFDFGTGSIMPQLIPSVPLRRLLTGFLFGSTGCLISLSPVGRISGAHINPMVSIAFWMRGKMKNFALVGYIVSQMLGAVAGCIPLLLWYKEGKSVNYGNTVPGKAGVLDAFAGEMITTACLILVVFTFVGSKKLRNYTPYTMPFLFGFMVWAEADLSGTSCNTARSFGPAVVSGVYTDFWLYIIAPLCGVIIIVGLFKWLRLHHYYHIMAARMSFHESPSPQTH